MHLLFNSKMSRLIFDVNGECKLLSCDVEKLLFVIRVWIGHGEWRDDALNGSCIFVDQFGWIDGFVAQQIADMLYCRIGSVLQTNFVLTQQC